MTDYVNDYPPYTYVPSLTPHPHRDEEGHQVMPMDICNGEYFSAFQLGCRLFEAGFYWEAHEAWEQVWLLASRPVKTDEPGSPNQQSLTESTYAIGFLLGLIKLAAAGVKTREANAVGVKHHLARAEQHLEQLPSEFYCPPILATCSLNHAKLAKWIEGVRSDWQTYLDSQHSREQRLDHAIHVQPLHRHPLNDWFSL